MADDILKAYLVSIGFKVDEADYKRFKDSQLETEKRTKDLSKAFSDFAKVGIGAAGVLGGMVLKVSSSLENLHFQAQKSGTSAQNLKAFGDAAAQIGIQAEDAMGIVQQFNNKIRDNPVGMGALLGNLGVNANQDKTKVLLDLVDKLAAISGPNADVQRTAYAAQFGISGEDIRTLIRGREELHKYYEERKLVYGDIDQQSLAAHKANEEFRDLQARFSALTNAIGIAFLPAAKSVVSVLEVVVKDLIDADKATNGWSSRIIGVGGALAGTAGTMAIVRGTLAGLTGASTAGAASMGVLATELLAVTGALLGIADAAAVIYKQFHLTPEEQKRHDKAVQEFHDAPINPMTGRPQSHGTISHSNIFLHPSGSSTGTTGTALRNPGNLRSWGSASTVERFRKGISIGRFAQFGSEEEGLDAMAGLLIGKAYAGAGINTIAGILNKYAPGSENNTAAYISDVAKRTGFSPEEHLDLSKSQTLASLMAAMIHHEQGRDPYTMGMITESANRRLSSETAGNRVTVKMDQKTDVNVYGSGDAQRAADLVAKNQEKVNAGLARDFAGAVQ